MRNVRSLQVSLSNLFIPAYSQTIALLLPAKSTLHAVLDRYGWRSGAVARFVVGAVLPDHWDSGPMNSAVRITKASSCSTIANTAVTLTIPSTTKTIVVTC